MAVKIVTLKVQGEHPDRFTKRMVDAIDAAKAVHRTQTGENVHVGVNIREPLMLGEMVDLAIKTKPGIRGGFYCVYCKAEAATPPQVQHHHDCVILRAIPLVRELCQ